MIDYTKLLVILTLIFTSTSMAQQKSQDRCALSFNVSSFENYDSTSCSYNYRENPNEQVLYYSPAPVTAGFDPVTRCITTNHIEQIIPRLLRTGLPFLNTNYPLGICPEQADCDGYNSTPTLRWHINGKYKVSLQVRSGSIYLPSGGTYTPDISCSF